jgi:DNA ligase-1
MDFHCMLAGKAPDNLKSLIYPTTVSNKLDGVRALVIGGVVYSRNMKPIPCQRVQAWFGRRDFNGLDGELIAGPANAPDVYRRTTSAVMSKTGDDDITFHVFDCFNSPNLPHRLRLEEAEEIAGGQPRVVIVAHAVVESAEEIDYHEHHALEEGYEGLMLRHPGCAYKNGRSTAREQSLLKLKRFDDSEAVIHDFEEQMHNANVAERDELGRTKRSTQKAGLKPAGVLGALVVQDVRSGAKFNVGTGFSAHDRDILWKQRKSLIGKVIKYKFFPSGNKQAPRFPTFAGFRDEIDM